MSTPPETPAPVRKGPNWILTTVGALIVFGIFILVNVLAGMSHSRFDMTANKVHTLTQGTKNILDRVDTTTTIRFFVSPKNMLPPQFQPFVDQTDSWLARFREVNPDHLVVEKKEVEPATDEQELATAAKIEPRQGQFYFGLSVSCLDKTANIDWVPEVLSTDGKEDDRIEYNLAKAISEVTRTKKKTVGLMSALPVEATFGSREWTFVSELKSQYDVKKIDVAANKIEDGMDVVILIHPAGITDEAQFAIDQYLLKGGRVIAFLDSNSFMAQMSRQNQNPMMAQMGQQGGVETSSTIGKLLTKWGYSYDTTKIVADPTFGMPLSQNLVDPVLLSIGANGIPDKQDELVKDLNSFFCVYSGGFAGAPASELKETIYLQTSSKHGMVGQEYALSNPTGPEAQKKAEELSYKLQPEGKPRILAMRLNGKFKTAFPEGKPPPPPPKPPGGAGHGGGFPGGFPGGLPPMGDQGAQGPDGQAAPPANPPAAAPANPPAAPAANPPAAPATNPPAAPATNPPAAPATATPPVAAPAPVTPAPTPTPAPTTPPATATTPPVSATTPPITIEPGSVTPAPATPATPPTAVPSPLPVTPAPAAKPGESPLLPPAAGVPQPPADSGSFLKEGEKEGVVYLVADSDMISDLQPTVQSGNFALALGMVDQATGDRDLMQVRSRGAATRPFDTLKEIMERANERIRKEVESMQADADKLNQDIMTQKNAKDRTTAWVKAMREMQQKDQELRKKIYAKQKEAKKEYDDAVFGIKWKNVFIPPIIVAIAGIGVLITRKIRTAAH